MRAKFIVIDGTDGSGKTTQWYLLAKKLRQEKISYGMVNFPIYQSFFGKMVRRYLNGEFGDPITVNAYLSCLPYALDRFFYKNKIEKLLKTKKVVLVNRYMTSNLIYQGAKIKNQKEREKFFTWARNLEFDLLRLPKPDLVIYLWVPAEVSARLIAHRQKKTSEKRRIDGHEKNLTFQKSVADVSKYLASTKKNWKMVGCYKNGILLSRQEIAGKVWGIVRNKLNS